MNALQALSFQYRQMYRRPCEWITPPPVCFIESGSSFRLTSRDLAGAFFDLLYFYRGHYLRRVDELLGPIVVTFIDGQRPSQAIPFGHINLGQMKKYPMDSEQFIEISRIVASSMSRRACQLEQHV